jgi:hypothetical protein
MRLVNVIFTDSASNLVLSQTRDIRVISLLKTIILDIDFFVLLPVRHVEIFDKFSKNHIQNNHEVYHRRKVETFNLNDEDLFLKKTLTLEKTKILETILTCADIKLAGHNHFFHPRMYDIIDHWDEKIIGEYSFNRNITIEEASKELKLKKSSFDVRVNKIQALIDNYVEELKDHDSSIELENYHDKIIQDFWL